MGADPGAPAGGGELGDQPPLVSRVLWQTENAVDQALDAVFASVGLSTTLQGTLRMIAARPGCSAADLARAAQVRPQSVAQAVSRLERLGMVTRSPHPVHGRVQQLTLTDTGHAALQQADSLLEHAEHDLTADLTAAQRDQFLGHLEALRVRAQDLHHRHGGHNSSGSRRPPARG